MCVAPAACAAPRTAHAADDGGMCAVRWGALSHADRRRVRCLLRHGPRLPPELAACVVRFLAACRLRRALNGAVPGPPGHLGGTGAAAALAAAEALTTGVAAEQCLDGFRVDAAWILCRAACRDPAHATLCAGVAAVCATAERAARRGVWRGKCYRLGATTPLRMTRAASPACGSWEQLLCADAFRPHGGEGGGSGQSGHSAREAAASFAAELCAAG
eukprot:gene23206-39619_t